MKHGRVAIYAVAFGTVLLISIIWHSEPRLPAEVQSTCRLHIYNSTDHAITVEYSEDLVLRRRKIEPSGTRTLNLQTVGLFELKVIEPASDAKFSRRLAPRRVNALLVDIGARGEFYKCRVDYFQGSDVNKPSPHESMPLKLPGPSALYEIDLAFEGINVPAPECEVGPLFCGIAVRYILVDNIGLKKREQGLPVGP